MKIKLKKKENSYAQVHKNMLFDRTLSLKAKGLGAILESYSNVICQQFMIHRNKYV